MHIPFRKATYEGAIAHGEALIEALSGHEEMQALRARAAALGIAVEVSLRHTYCDDIIGVPAIPARSGRLPHGYVMELWFDLTQDNKIVMSRGDNPVQLSCSTPCAKETGAFPFFRLTMMELDEVLSEGSVLPILEEYLDEVEEAGCDATPFLANRLYPDALTDEVAPVNLGDIEDGAYVELSLYDYDGTVGEEDSLYIPKQAFLPYELLVSAVCDRPWEGDNPRHLTLSGEEADALCTLLEDVRGMMRRRDFADFLSEAGVSHLTPPPAAEYLCHLMTYGRKKEFLSDIDTILAHLSLREGGITLID